MMKESSLSHKFKETLKHGLVLWTWFFCAKNNWSYPLPIYTSHLTISEYGVLGLLSSTGQILAVLVLIGMGVSIFRSYYDYTTPKERDTVVSTGFMIILANCVFFTVIRFLFYNRLSTLIFGSDIYSFYILLIFFITIIGILTVVPYTLMRMEKKSIIYIVFQGLFLLISLSLIIYFVTISKLGIFGILLGKLIVVLISISVLYIAVRKHLYFRFNKCESKKMLLYGFPLVPLIFAFLS